MGYYVLAAQMGIDSVASGWSNLDIYECLLQGMSQESEAEMSGHYYCLSARCLSNRVWVCRRGISINSLGCVSALGGPIVYDAKGACHWYAWSSLAVQSAHLVSNRIHLCAREQIRANGMGGTKKEERDFGAEE